MQKQKSPRKAILKSDDGLIQLYQCPVCLYFIKWVDMMFDEMHDPTTCKWCANDNATTKDR